MIFQRNLSYDKQNLTLLNLLNSLRKRDKCSTSLAFYRFSLARLIYSIKHEPLCNILYINLLQKVVNLLRVDENAENYTPRPRVLKKEVTTDVRDPWHDWDLYSRQKLDESIYAIVEQQ